MSDDSSELCAQDAEDWMQRAETLISAAREPMKQAGLTLSDGQRGTWTVEVSPAGRVVIAFQPSKANNRIQFQSLLAADGLGFRDVAGLSLTYDFDHDRWVGEMGAASTSTSVEAMIESVKRARNVVVEREKKKHEARSKA